MTQLINLTPHTLNVMVNDAMQEIPASGTVARVSVKSVVSGDINGIPVVENVYGEVEGLPEPVDGAIYIVSMLVGSRVSGRNDIVGPDSGPTAIRENGQVKAVRNLIKYS